LIRRVLTDKLCVIHIIFKTINMKIFVIALLVALACSDVIPFNNDAIEKVFKDSNDALFLFLGDE
jgi:hypothetical protein